MGVDYLKRQFPKLFQQPHKLKLHNRVKIMQKTLLAASVGSALLLLPACQKAPISGPTGALTLTTRKPARDTIVTIAKTAQNCWFKPKDPAFTIFKLAAEVNSHAGQPRFLLVPKNNPAGLPKLVVQAQTIKGRTVINAFGPLLSSDNGQRISSDVQRWANGNKNCAA